MSVEAATLLPILIVEDDLDMRFLIQSTLRDDPRLNLVAQTATAMEALSLTLKMDPALVILDHQIEGEIMGLQAAPLIKSVAPETRIILFTSEDLSYEASKEPAIDLYLPKNDLKKLVAIVQRLLGLEPLT